MIFCKLLKVSLSDNLHISTDASKLCEDSVCFNIDPEKMEHYVKIQEEYRNMQKELKFLFQLHSNVKV